MTSNKIPYRMTIFEKASILGHRAKQISEESPVQVNTDKEIDPLRIARKELMAGKIMMSIKRTLPCGKVIEIPVNEFIIP